MTCAVSLEPAAVAERQQRVAALTRAGYTAAQIATLEGISDRSVVRYRAKMGVSRLGPKSPLSDDELRAAAKLLDEGCSYMEVGRTLGRSPRCISQHLPGRGWPKGEGGRFGQQIRWMTYQAASVGVLL